jgi:hypothetical protein
MVLHSHIMECRCIKPQPALFRSHLNILKSLVHITMQPGQYLSELILASFPIEGVNHIPNLKLLHCFVPLGRQNHGLTWKTGLSDWVQFACGLPLRTAADAHQRTGDSELDRVVL